MNFLKKIDFESIRQSGKSGGLEKTLTAMDLILLGLGGIIGTGVFALTGMVAADYAGPAVSLSYALAGLTCIFVALAYTELASMLPTSGSVYTYSYVALGEVFAWIIGSVLIIELSFAAGAVAAVWSKYAQSIFTSAGIDLPQALLSAPYEGGIINLPAVFIVLLVGFMLYRGTKESKMLNNVLVAVKLIAIFGFVVLAAPNFDASNWENFMPNGFDDVLRGASILFFSFSGFGVLATTAEECKNPKKDLTIGIIGSLLIATLVYVIVAGILTGLAPYNELGSADSLAYALRKHGSNFGSAIIATGAVAGMTTVIMMNIYGQSRIFYVIARDGLLPSSLAKLHHKYDSPYFSIIIFSILIALMGGLLPYEILSQLAAMAALTDYIFVAIIVMLFRITKPNIERPFKCPVIFVIAPVALLACLYLLFSQIIGKHNELLLTGKIFIIWILTMLALYVVKKATSKKQEN